MYTDDELAGYGFTPYHLGEPVDVAIVQADHDDYRSLTADELPGREGDHRRAGDPARAAFPEVDVRVIGRAVASA